MAEYDRTIGLGDLYGTRAEITVHEHDEEEDPQIQFGLMAGQCGGRGYMAPDVARQMSAALLDAADAAEEEADRG